MQIFEFSEEASHVIDLVKNSNKSLFVTGKAGTGKSTLLKHIVQHHADQMVVVAPTGVAAIHVNGDTIHSFFKLKPGFEKDEAIHVRINKNMEIKLKTLKTIVIDEISMVRADLLDAIDILLKRARKIPEDFGGVRMIFFGDMYQLPPVVHSDDKNNFYSKYNSPFFFSAEVFKQKDLFTPAIELERIELKKIYRQSDKHFIKLLNVIRNGSITQNELDELNLSVNPHFTPDNKDKKWIHLVGTNQQAREINQAHLHKINHPAYYFNATSIGKIGSLQPNDKTISLKMGAQIIFIQNDSYKRWVNGSIGTIKAITEKLEKGEKNMEIEVVLDNGKTVVVEKHTWEISKYVLKKEGFSREQIGTFTQLPLKLAWAITIHKSQGKTFEHCIIDLGRGGFAHGQCYVALSRCKSLKNLILKQAITQSDIIVEEKIKEFEKQ